MKNIFFAAFMLMILAACIQIEPEGGYEYPCEKYNLLPGTKNGGVLDLLVIRWEDSGELGTAYDGASYDTDNNVVLLEERAIPTDRQPGIPFYVDDEGCDPGCSFICRKDLASPYLYWVDTAFPDVRFVEVEWASEPDYRVEEDECYCMSYPHEIMAVEVESAQF